MSVQIAFQRSDGGFVHRLICWVTHSEFAHCEIVIDGVGYGWRGGKTKGSTPPSLAITKEFPEENWVLIDAVHSDGRPWSVEIAREWVTAHWYAPYDRDATLSHVIPVLRENPNAINCSEAVSQLGACEGDVRFVGKTHHLTKPSSIYQLFRRPIGLRFMKIIDG